uniref:Uncharacterized protein n=1 Tax=Anguilla anguilla TaxID=7936 RepID=A0A0E9PDJ3_ANGAN
MRPIQTNETKSYPLTDDRITGRTDIFSCTVLPFIREVNGSL